jgi:hypothetical protein
MLDDSCRLSVRHCDMVHSVRFDLLLGAAGVTGVLICHSARNGQRKSQNTVQKNPKRVALIVFLQNWSCLTVIPDTYVSTDVTAERGGVYLKLSQLVKVASSTNEYTYLQRVVLKCFANKYFKQTMFIHEHNSKD